MQELGMGIDQHGDNLNLAENDPRSLNQSLIDPNFEEITEEQNGDSQSKKLENFFRIFCVINVLSFLVIIFFVKKHVWSWKSLSAYRIYCLALACSDLILSVDGFFAVSELDSFFTDELVLQGFVKFINFQINVSNFESWKRVRFMTEIFILKIIVAITAE